MKIEKVIVRSILCVHQGYELYGSDRSFVLSVSILRELYPNAKIDVVIPKEGPICELIEPVATNLIINEKLAILRKKELKNNPLSLIFKTIKGVFSAIILSKEYDLVYVNTIVVLDYIFAARFMKCSTILHIREIPIGFQSTIFSKLISFSKMALIFNSQNTMQAFMLPVNQPKTVILNGVKGFTDIVSKEEFGSITNILLIGRLTSWKGQLFFLEALARLMETNKFDLKIRIVGEVFEDQIGYKYDLQNFVQEHQLDDMVEFKLFTDDPESEYEWSDIVVIPSIKPEPFGRVAIEAMSAHRCVIAANHGGLSEIIDSEIDGLLFEPNNIDSLVKSLKKVLESKELIDTFTQEGFKKFKCKFSDEVYKNTFIKTLQELAKQ